MRAGIVSEPDGAADRVLPSGEGRQPRGGQRYGAIGDDGTTVAVGDVAEPTRRCFAVAFAALERVGASSRDVVRTRVMLRDISRWEEAAAVRGASFTDVRRACTFVEVSRFIDPERCRRGAVR